MNTDTTVKSGTLYVVATPVGNLEDITFRAVRILQEVDLIAAEDTRHTARLLSHYNIKNSVISCHEHNEMQRLDLLLDKLSQGKNIALVSDAGTPTISDPGYQLVKKVAQEGIRVVPIPGPSAAIAGLSVSGLPTDSFLFMGFLHRKKGRRQSALQGVKDEVATLIFYESPRRIIVLLEELISILGDRPAMVAREITKFTRSFSGAHCPRYLKSSSPVLPLRENVLFLWPGKNQHLWQHPLPMKWIAFFYLPLQPAMSPLPVLPNNYRES